jgi:WD40 repeat protein
MRLAVENGSIPWCGFDPVRAVFTTGGSDGLVRFWDRNPLPAVVGGHEAPIVSGCYSTDGQWVATGDTRGEVNVWRARTFPRPASANGEGRISWCGFNPQNSLLATARGSDITLWQTRSWEAFTTLELNVGRIVRCAFSPSGDQLAVGFDRDGFMLCDLTLASPPGRRALESFHTGTMTGLSYSPDGRWLATASADGLVALTDMTRSGTQVLLDTTHGPIRWCQFSPTGRAVAAGGDEGTIWIWDIGSLDQPAEIRSVALNIHSGAFSSDGELLAASAESGMVGVWDVSTGHMRTALEGHNAPVRWCEFAVDDSLLATADEAGVVQLWEPNAFMRSDGGVYIDDSMTSTSSSTSLASVLSDVPVGVDLLDLGTDINAIANLVAATETEPPLAIGLFGDWGSGKSFLIGKVRERVQELATRSRDVDDSAYCSHVRNVSFNAWHYADANLWASLVTHIFDELAKPEPEAGVNDERVAAIQMQRLEERLAESSSLADRLRRAHSHKQQVQARRSLLRWTWALAGVDDQKSLDDVQEDVEAVSTGLRILLPNSKARAVALSGALVVAVAIATIVLALGIPRLVGVLATAVGTFTTGFISLKLAARHVSDLLDRSGKLVRASEVRSDNIDAELESARTAEEQLRSDLTDLSSGRRLARLASERGGDYRDHLGLVSRIHEDFLRMSSILRAAQHEPLRSTYHTSTVDDLPRIDRIALYIDDLDRCPPRRIVEVLEAIHLILAVPLFVVVVAVDPRWLLQSLRLHYAELLGHDRLVDIASAEPQDAWHPTPLDYLEKIIQVPLALRPMNKATARSLVHGLLPIEDATTPARSAGLDTRPENLERLETGEFGNHAEESVSSGLSGSDAHLEPDTLQPKQSAGMQSSDSETKVVFRAGLSPTSLVLTSRERDFAAAVAAGFRTPRAVKKFTNLYRLIRVGVIERERLDRFLRDEARDAPDYQVVQILLAVIIEFADEASDFLLGFGDIAGHRMSRLSWESYVIRSEPQSWSPRLATFLIDLPPSTIRWTCEPFRRWALEVSRYSFATGQEVFARRFNLGGT